MEVKLAKKEERKKEDLPHALPVPMIIRGHYG
jgi:hypothetical protein